MMAKLWTPYQEDASRGRTRYPGVVDERAGGFDPRGITSCTGWFAADHLRQADDTDVATWVDQTGTANMTQATDTKRPHYRTNKKNGLPALQHVSGSQQHLMRSRNEGVPCSIFSVAALRVGGTANRGLAASLNNWMHGFYNNGHREFYFEGWVYNPGIGSSGGTFYLHESTIQGPGLNSTVWENGTQYASNTSGVTGPNYLITSGYANPPSSEFMDIDFCELIIYGKIVSTAERQAIENYLNSKWDLW